MALRGFDDYLVTLGDEMRGHRATLGASLPELERILRIRSGTILAIENGDLDAFPNPGSVPGLVRVYARHIGMDPQETFRRFCEETGFSSPTALATVGEIATRGGRRIARNSGVGAILTESRFAALPARRSITSAVRAMLHAVLIATTVAGLGYYGNAAFGYIQQLAVVPLPPERSAVTPVLAGTTVAPVLPRWASPPDASVYDEGGALSPRFAGDLSARGLASRTDPVAEVDDSRLRAAATSARLQQSAGHVPGGSAHARRSLEDRTERAAR